MRTTSRSTLDTIFLWTFCLLGAATLIALAVYPAVTVPADDAIILHQYSRNLAETGVISFIPNGPRTEGATDFLWMLYIAAGMKLHISATLSTAIANVASAIGLVLILLRLAHRKFSWPALLAILGALGLLPQTQAAMVGFSVLPFCFAIALTVMFLEEDRDKAAAISALCLCLLRPDGIIFAIPLILRRLTLAPPRARRVIIYIGLFVLPGICYFLWRWHYFHQFLPLPFLVKSDTHRVLGLFAPGSQSVVRYFLFAAIVIGCTLGKRAFARRQASLLLVLIVVPTMFYDAVRLDQNIFSRFYVYLPLAAALILAQNWDHTELSRRHIAVVSLGAFGILLASKTVKDTIPNLQAVGRRNDGVIFAKALSAPRLRGTMLVSEAGVIPYFSEWTAYDSWGLNTAAYATHLIQPEDVIQLAPDLIVFHPDSWDTSCSARTLPPLHERTWDNMTANVRSGIAMSQNYEAWREVVVKGVAKGESGSSPDVVRCWYISNRYRERVELDTLLTQIGASRDTEQ